MKRRFSLKFLSILILSIGFIGCGDDSSTSTKDKIADHTFLWIIYNSHENQCNSANNVDLRNALEMRGATDILFATQSNNVTCDTYGKRNNGVECTIFDNEEIVQTSCVIAFNKNFSKPIQ